MWPGDWGDELGALPLWGRLLVGCPCMLLIVAASVVAIAGLARRPEE